MEITQEQLSAVMPRCTDAGGWTTALNAAMDEFQIAANPYRIAAFLAQTACESAQLTQLAENLYYSSAARLMAVWPSRFPTTDAAQPYVGQPEKLADLVYALRMGNGDVASGDGWRFRGRGIIQLTGRGTYASAATALNLNLLDDPDQLTQQVPAARSAGWFWNAHGLNELADDINPDTDAEDFVTISIRINGGRQGLAQRQAYWATARSALGISAN